MQSSLLLVARKVSRDGVLHWKVLLAYAQATDLKSIQNLVEKCCSDFSYSDIWRFKSSLNCNETVKKVHSHLPFKGQAISKAVVELGEERWDLAYFTSLQSEGDGERCPRQHKGPWPGWWHFTVLHSSLVSSLDETMYLHSDKFSNLTPSRVSLVANLKRFAPP